MTTKKVFISYSWDSQEHQDWVKKLADDLEQLPEFHVLWDGYDLDSSPDKNQYMEESVYSSDHVIVVATKNYRIKADDRKGGVGIETYLNTARHWQNLLEAKQSNTVVVLKERDAVPNYLNGHLWIDFTKDEDYPKNIESLINKLSEKNKHKRPSKIANQPEIKAYKLTKAADIIGIGARNRKCIIPLQDGTDFSGSNRIKYELWETKSPITAHILALHNNINIHQTLKRAAETIVSRGDIEITNLIILRPNEKRKNSISFDAILSELTKDPRKSSFNLTELTYEDYIWNYCIDESFKTVQPPDAIDFYTTQELQSQIATFESATSHLLEKLTNETGCYPQLVIGGGGYWQDLSLSISSEIANKGSQPKNTNHTNQIGRHKKTLRRIPSITISN